MDNSKKYILGIDLDDVLLDFNAQFCLYHNGLYKTSLCREDIVTYDMEKVWDLPINEMLNRVSEFYVSEAHSLTPPIADSVEVINRLSNRYELHIITSRPDYTRESVLSWLEKHFTNLFTAVHFTNQYLGDPKYKRNKSDVCIENNISIFIDDAPKYVKDVASKGIQAFLFDAPWNRRLTNPLHNIERVHGWKHIQNILLN